MTLEPGKHREDWEDEIGPTPGSAEGEADPAMQSMEAGPGATPGTAEGEDEERLDAG